MNPRQRRAVLFLTVATIFLLVGISALGSYVGGVREEVGPKVPVLVLGRDAVAFESLSEDDVDVVEVPRHWAPDNALTSAAQAIGMVPSTHLSEGSYLTEDTISEPPELGPGEREIAILIDAETGVAGKVRRGHLVDIVATYTDSGTGVGSSEIIVPGARVLEVGNLREASENDDDGDFETSRVVPITFALSVDNALVLAHAESFATQVRLALIDPREDTSVPAQDGSYTRPADTGPADTGDA
jgi:pilus assembly protein CpaB